MNARYDVLVKQLMEERSVNKELKEKDQMKWVQEMNDIEHLVIEFIKENYTYSK